LDAAENYAVSDYIYDMPCQMAAADLVICRAGAMTISELALMGKAAILIPSPNVTDNHQYLNAKVLADAGIELDREMLKAVDGGLALNGILIGPCPSYGTVIRCRNDI
jgi:UDP:flavonoid glycosyltransferase YjiC (YdhE family)